jgi:hypothetical protein
MLAGLPWAIACGGRADSPTAPPQLRPEQNPASLHLNSGEYLLGIELSTSGTARCENGICVSLSLCLGGSTLARTDVRVMIDRQQDDITVRALDPPATFRMALRATGAAVSGTASGSATGTDGLHVSIGGSSGAAAVAGTAAVVTALAGTLDGALTIGASNCSNNAHVWTLAKRS